MKFYILFGLEEHGDNFVDCLKQVVKKIELAY